MVARHRGLAVTSAVAAIALVAAACGGGGGSGSKSSQSSGATQSSGGSSQPAAGPSSKPANQQSNANSGGKVKTGGTLKLIGNADVDHLDTAAGYYTVTTGLMRAFARQLYTYPASTDLTKATEPVPDIATAMPTKSNGGISADGKTYTIHIRSGVKWNTSPARPVKASDFVLGFKRLCNPTQNSVGAPGYYEGVIVGMDTYCKPFAKVSPTVAAFKSYIGSHDIAGIKAVNDSTIKFELVRPAGDFVNILALSFSSPTPKEYLDYLPDSAGFRQHTISDGPYTIAKYVPNQSYMLDKNPSWSQASDSVRHQYVDHIQVTLGPDENAVQQQIAANTQDLEWDTTVPTAQVPQLKAQKDPRLGIYPSLSTNPFLIFNMQSPSNKGALGKVKVRQAIEYAIDKVALGQIYGGPSLNTPLDQVIPPGNVGYKQFDLYSTSGHRGDPGKCKSMLAAAGYPHGLVLKDVYRTSGKHPSVYQSVQADLKRCGITVKGTPSAASDYYGKYLSDPAAAKKGTWDISEPGWLPDWFGNNARAIVEPLFDGRTYGPGSTDWGDYNNATVNTNIDKALATTDKAAITRYIHAADMQIMKDAAFVPFQTQSTPLYRSTRVHNAIELPATGAYDITQVWLS